ncbi:leucine-rich repeat-containing protein 43 isoform X2 [Pleurodeles waltl]|uniref:leucine-rich repeat-containing protein 43 isoform X2 n=1 Tax=Pleurodeles waltl TaxID=8319 RepID=UPI003709B0B4
MTAAATASGAFTEQLRALCLMNFPGGLGSWNKTRFELMKIEYLKETYWEDEKSAAGEENPDALKELLASNYSPWALEEIWSPDVHHLREASVDAPQLISEAFIFSQFKSLRIVDKQVEEVDHNLLKFLNLEELILSANKIRTINSANLPRKLKVLELCANEIDSLSGLCCKPPNKIQHLGLGYNRLFCPSESKYLTGHYWPNLLSLDLSFNNLTDLRCIISKIITLEHLRILVLQGNPLALLPWYHGFTINNLPKLSVLDDVVISADGRLQYKGLSEREDLMRDAAHVFVNIGRLKGLPHPLLPSEQEDVLEYPVTTYNYYVTYNFVCELDDRDMENTKVATENTAKSPVQFVSAVEDHPKPPEDNSETKAIEFVAMNPLLKQAQLDSSVSSYSTAVKSWEEVIDNNYRQEHVLGDLLGLKAFLLHGTTVAVIEEKTLYWPAKEVSVEGGKPQSAKKDGKAKEHEKQKEKGSQSAKDRKASGKQKKKKVNLSELRPDAPIRRILGSLRLQMEKLVGGEQTVDTVCDFGVLATTPIVETAKNKERVKAKRLQMI